MTSRVSAQGCSVDCLRVYSIDLSDFGTAIGGTVKLTDEAVSAGAARSSVVHGVWTRPDGSQFDQYANIGTRLRAEFRLYTGGEPGLYMLTVADATKAGYTFDPANSAVLSESIQIGGAGNQSPVAISNADATSGSVPLTINFDSQGSRDPDGTVVGRVWLLDEHGDPVTDATVLAQWTLPDGSTVDQSRDSGSNARAYFAHEADATGQYALTVIEVIKAGHTFDPDGSNVLDGMINITP
jgi:hypothetical protein